MYEPELEAWPDAAPAAIRTLGLHAPHGNVWQDDGTWIASFLNRRRKLGASMPWRGNSEHPEDQLWLMNLHYFEYLPDQDDETSIKLIVDWIANCRPHAAHGRSTSWSSYAVSLRVSAWLEFWAKRGPIGDSTFHSLLFGSLREQGNYLAANLETDVCGNHLIKNLRALTELSAFFGHSANPRWARLVNKHLPVELREQILPDGVHFERSPSYHCQVFADLMMIFVNRPKDGLSDAIGTALSRMAQATADLTHPDGFVAQFNDAGLNMSVSPIACLKAFAVVFALDAPSPQSHFAYSHGGFYGSRIGQDYTIVKMGLLGPDQLMAHAHGDWGSFEWSLDGQRVVVDPGVFEYVAGESRQASRSTKTHNTATVGDCEQAEFFGAFRCGRRLGESRVSFAPHPEGFTLEGEWESRISGRVIRHSRQVISECRGLTIEDNAEGSDTKIEARILLHPLVSAHLIQGEDDEPEEFQSRALKIKVASNARAQILSGQWSPDMGVVMNTQRVSISGSHTVRIKLAVVA